MSWLDHNPLDDGVQDYVLLAANDQVPVEIVRSEPANEQAQSEGKLYVHLVLKPLKDDGQFYSTIHHYLHFPKETDEAEAANRKRMAFRDFCEAFQISPADQRPSQCETWVGRTATALVALANDQQYGQRNEVKRFLK